MSRAVYVYRPGHPKADRWNMVDVNELGEEPVSLAINASFMVGRFYENTAATDGTDIGSRRKHKEYMRRHGLTTADDYGQTWAKATEKREAVRREETGSLPSKTRRDVIARKLYEIDKP